jgi:hypothetical protein
MLARLLLIDRCDRCLTICRPSQQLHVSAPLVADHAVVWQLLWWQEGRARDEGFMIHSQLLGPVPVLGRPHKLLGMLAPRKQQPECAFAAHSCARLGPDSLNDHLPVVVAVVSAAAVLCAQPH